MFLHHPNLAQASKGLLKQLVLAVGLYQTQRRSMSVYRVFSFSMSPRDLGCAFAPTYGSFTCVVGASLSERPFLTTLFIGVELCRHRIVFTQQRHARSHYPSKHSVRGAIRR
jgi:hypothetical protein